MIVFLKVLESGLIEVRGLNIQQALRLGHHGSEVCTASIFYAGVGGCPSFKEGGQTVSYELPILLSFSHHDRALQPMLS